MQKVCKVMLISSKAELYGAPDFRRPLHLVLRELDFFLAFFWACIFGGFFRILVIFGLPGGLQNRAKIDKNR